MWRKKAIDRENYYIKFLKPEYNILSVEGSSLGLRHSKEAIEKIRVANIGRKHSKETIEKLTGRALSAEHITKLRDHLAKLHPVLNKKKGIVVKVTNIETGEIFYYDSIRIAAKEFNTSHNSLRNYIKSQKPYQGKFIISPRLLKE